MFASLRKHLPVLAFCCVASTLIAVAAGGCSNSTTPGPMATSTPASATLALPAAGQQLVFPPHGGFSGFEVIPNNNAPAGTNVTLHTYTRTPGGAPPPQSFARRSPQSVNPALPPGSTVIFWESEQFSSALTFDDFPETSLTMPSSISTSTNTFMLETIDSNGNLLLVSQPQEGQPAGQTVTFAAVVADFQVNTSDTYWLEVIAEPISQPSPSPSPSVAPSPSPSASPSHSPSPSPSPSHAPSPSPSPSVAPSPSPSSSPCNPDFGACAVMLSVAAVPFPDVPPAQWGCGGNPYEISFTATETGFSGTFSAVSSNTTAATITRNSPNAFTANDVWTYPNGNPGPNFNVVVSDGQGNSTIIFGDFNGICLP